MLVFAYMCKRYLWKDAKKPTTLINRKDKHKKYISLTPFMPLNHMNGSSIQKSSNKIERKARTSKLILR